MLRLSQILRCTQNDKIPRDVGVSLLGHHPDIGRTRHTFVRPISGGHRERFGEGSVPMLMVTWLSEILRCTLP